MNFKLLENESNNKITIVHNVITMFDNKFRLSNHSEIKHNASGYIIGTVGEHLKAPIFSRQFVAIIDNAIYVVYCDNAYGCYVIIKASQKLCDRIARILNDI